MSRVARLPAMSRVARLPAMTRLSAAAPRLTFRAATALLAWAALASPAAACSVCYGNADNGSPLVTAARLGVFLLLGITAAVLAGFVRFFFVLRKRALAAERDAIALERSEFQRSPTP
jgi:hypothetical protein